MTTSVLLMVEADILIRTPIASYLRDCGFTVLEASSGNEALLLLQHAGPAIDLVLAAVDLDGEMNGFDVAHWVRAHLPTTGVLLAGSVSKAAHIAAGLCDQGPYLDRPYDPQIVIERIRRLLASRRST